MPMYVRLPRNERVIADTGPYPSYLNMLDRKATAVQRALRRAGPGGYEPSVQATILASVQASKRRVFYDVGAHIGYYSAVVTTIFRDVQAVAFEPTPSTSDALVRIRDTNGLNFVVVRKAISDAIGELTFFLSPKAETSNSLNEDFRPGAARVTVEGTTLDRVWMDGLPPPGVIKIDVETHEASVLEGAMSLIQTCKPTIICEFLDVADLRRVQDCLRALAFFGYHFHPIGRKSVRRSMGAVEAIEAVKAGNRDWVLSPRRLSSSFSDTMGEWLHALEQCPASTTLYVDADGAKPAEINQTYTLY